MTNGCSMFVIVFEGDYPEQVAAESFATRLSTSSGTDVRFAGSMRLGLSTKDLDDFINIL